MLYQIQNLAWEMNFVSHGQMFPQKKSPWAHVSFTERAVVTFISHSLPLPEKSPPGDGWWGVGLWGSHTLVTFLYCRWGRPRPTSYTRPWSPTTNWSPRKAWTRSRLSSASSPGKGHYPLPPNSPSSDNEQWITFDNTDEVLLQSLILVLFHRAPIK